MVLVLAGPTDADVARAILARDPVGLPRWSVVAIRGASPDANVEAVAEEDWTPVTVRLVLRLRVAEHRLRREIASLRGDLLTFGLRIAHDLRTPLGGIAVSAETLKDALSEDFPEDLPLVKPISDSCDEMAALIRQVSIVAKATARPVVRERVGMGSVVWAARERLAPAIREAKATINEAKSWPEVVGDAVSLETIWWNLLSNALRHSGKEPKIDLGWEPVGETLRFWVSDHGTGVPEKNRRLLFYPFSRLHEPNAMRGLGLPIVQRLVQLTGGYCGYESVAGGGGRFFFVLSPSAAH
jgi:signal transduction histidine kinase